MFVINFNDLFTYFGGPKPPQEFEYVRWIKMKRKKKNMNEFLMHFDGKILKKFR